MNRLTKPIFICTAITSKRDKPKEIAELRERVERIDKIAGGCGITTVCAFREEKWQGLEQPELYVVRDFEWAKECEGAVIMREKSHGVLIEEGWLSAFGKPMLRLHQGAEEYKTGLEKGLGTITPVFDRVFHTIDDIVQPIIDFIEFLKQKNEQK
ncbi:hypothetical protein HZC07_03615 [Candidatus Micrarchaeota archaeon]|nr:hypothetical protein [Candidatus Micrarchaeota archaeon]